MLGIVCALALTLQCSAAEEPHSTEAGHEKAAAPAEDHASAHASEGGHEVERGAVSDHHAGAEHGSDHGHGPYTIWGDLSLWSFVAFIGFCWAINKLGLWNLLITTMDTREKAAWARLDAADAKLSQAESALRKFRGQFEILEDTVRATVAEGERDVNHTKAMIVANAQQEAQASVTRAKFEIERVKDHALHSLFETLAEKVVASAEASLRSQVQSGDQDRLIDATLGQLVR